MKKSPQLERLEQTLRSSRLSARGFLGDDKRSLYEILDADASVVASLGYTMKQIAARMQEITDAARKGLGDWVDVDKNLLAWASDARGIIACPWPHAFRADKTVITVERTDSGKSIQWADLNVHLIAEHGFFQGKGSAFRLEPRDLVEIIF
ncbi:hypothetical protein GF359_01525 [candidate division WOR-3 bacterium]|uniref:Uncharacterized protein n=1 Tax=candidate division WOR-3 bacterium TaxID=2052148 RepID=A0A9D5K820_UNCW3|nr:hypothetical protein [candidate division WOR-3 bacterium]MBD3363875.1 hypothetical protein [candidate division WOR-3 bacterium]